MKNAFVNADGVLTAWGFIDTNGNDTVVEVSEDFDKEPGKWRLNGGEWEAYAPEVTVPTFVTMRQARLALLGAGLLDDVTAAIDALPGPQKAAASIEWEFAAKVERSSPVVALLAQVLSLDDEQLDELFTTAAAL